MSYTNPFPLVPSASEMHRIAACPPSKKMAAAAKDYSDHKDADKGNEVHAILAGEEDADSSPYDAVQTAEMCEEQAQRLLNEWQDMGAESPLGFKEVRYGMTTLGNVVLVTPETRADLIVTGQFDRLYIQGNRGLLIDFKALHGKHAHALENAQLATLAVLVSRRHTLDELRVAIVQPWKGKPTVADYDDEGLWKARQWLNSVLENESLSIPGDRSAGDHCNHCNARFGCETFRFANLQEVERIDPTTIAGMDDETQAAAMWARASALTPEQHIAAYNGLAMVKRYAHAIGASFKAQVEAGEIPGYMTREKKGKRSISDVATVFARAAAQGVTAEAFTAECSIALGALNGLLKEATGARGKALEAITAEVLRDATETSRGSTEVVKLTLEGEA